MGSISARPGLRPQKQIGAKTNSARNFPRRVPDLYPLKPPSQGKVARKPVEIAGFEAKKRYLPACETNGFPEGYPAILALAGKIMAEDTLTTVGIGRHGAARLPSVDVDSFNIELKDDDGFLGDRASKGAFRKILDDLRKPLKKNGDDPLGGKSAEKISKSELDEALVGDDIGA
ncbi:MAG: hypothetical protein WBW26_11945, partial [Bradyrhizobium sp.]